MCLSGKVICSMNVTEIEWYKQVRHGRTKQWLGMHRRQSENVIITLFRLLARFLRHVGPGLYDFDHGDCR